MRFCFVLFVAIFILPVSLWSQQLYKRQLMLMGCRFEITVVANDEQNGQKYIDLAIDEISRIEHLISSWEELSETSEIIRNAGIKPVKVSAELLDLIDHAHGISQLTDGAFDITYASINALWKYDGSMKNLPSDKDIKASVSKIGYQNIKVNHLDSTVFLPDVGMRIGFGAIGKGFAADKAKALLIGHGVTAGIINASGDMTTWGSQPNGEDWKVAITNPMDKNKVCAWFPMLEGAVATSGNYEKYVILNGKRYSHIIDPRTGYPATGLVSVTIFSPKAELCDALATAIFVMGKDAGLDRINQLPHVECVLIDDEGNIFTSENIKIQKQ